MPIYEYACESCRHAFEIKQRFSDEPLTTCPECGQPVRRVLHAAGVIFKGSGWYITDSRKSDSATVGSGSSETKKDATPAPAND